MGGAGASAGTGADQAGSFGMNGSWNARHPLGSECVSDGDCMSGTWCTHGTCSQCDDAPTDCREGFSLTARNGCSWCAPPNECVTDASCGEGMVCFSGSQCDPGCDDLTCCHGNLCGDPDCGPPDQLDCSVVGCPDGIPCTGTSLARDCRCEHHQWLCDMSDGLNQCGDRPN